MYVYMCMYMYLYVCIYVFVYMYVYMCVYVSVDIYIFLIFCTSVTFWFYINLALLLIQPDGCHILIKNIITIITYWLGLAWYGLTRQANARRRRRLLLLYPHARLSPTAFLGQHAPHRNDIWIIFWQNWLVKWQNSSCSTFTLRCDCSDRRQRLSPLTPSSLRVAEQHLPSVLASVGRECFFSDCNCDSVHITNAYIQVICYWEMDRKIYR